MTTLSADTSVVGSIGDLDGYTIRDFNFSSGSSFGPLPDEDFGFDPPQLKSTSLNNYQAYSPPNDLSLNDWPDFGREDEFKPSMDTNAMDLDAYALPTSTSAVSRFGQMTPPRSNSAASTDSASDGKLSPKSTVPERRKRSKATSKDPEPVTSTSTTTSATTHSSTTGRKRKASRKASASTSDMGDSAEDRKRRQSLEKNRLAAAKCRINKKEKTEKLQQDSHEKAVQNAYLKDQVMRMKDEIQQMNAMLLAHASCEGCKAPEEVQAHLSNLGSDFFHHHLSMSSQSFGDYPPLNLSDLPVLPDNFLSSTSPDQILNPPLPDFDRSAEFEVHTPLQAD